MVVELIDDGGMWWIQDKDESLPKWPTNLSVGTQLAEVGIQSYNKEYIKQAIKLKEAGFETDDIISIMREAL